MLSLEEDGQNSCYILFYSFDEESTNDVERQNPRMLILILSSGSRDCSCRDYTCEDKLNKRVFQHCPLFAYATYVYVYVNFPSLWVTSHLPNSCIFLFSCQEIFAHQKKNKYPFLYINNNNVIFILSGYFDNLYIKS